jgi:hypothetical protein
MNSTTTVAIIADTLLAGHDDERSSVLFAKGIFFGISGYLQEESDEDKVHQK